MHANCIAGGDADETSFVTCGASMTTTILRPDSAVGAATFRNNASEEMSSTTVELLAADLPKSMQEQPASSGMTEDDTVCVLEVLAEMQRIIDRHLEKTEKLQGES
jgi:hypothetical protein